MAVLEYGLKTGNERVIVIDAKTGAIVADETGTPNHVEWLMDTAYKGKIVTVHNHPNNMPFSSLDLYTFGKIRQTLCMGVQGHNGATYALRKTDDIPFTISEDALTSLFRRIGRDQKHINKTYIQKCEISVAFVAKKMRWVFLKGVKGDG
ncbi:MAG: hypothetical protein LBI54_01760 [Lachnospiraceae bacterium]|jgi:hypothetical protein|nr:hypothetical protein [Lachnospiraceae bacterium]